jgi:hypothetical protein
MPWTIRPADMQIDSDKPLMGGYFKDMPDKQPIPLEDLEREYCRLTNQPYPTKDIVFVRSFVFFRVRELHLWTSRGFYDPYRAESSYRVLQRVLHGSRRVRSGRTYTHKPSRYMESLQRKL